MQDIFKEINDAVDIIDLVSNYVKLEKRGANYMGLCPFHDEKTPSFSVNPVKKIAKCMGCKMGGSPITFYSQIEGIQVLDAAKKLADKYHIEFNHTIKENKTDEFKTLYEITNFSKKFYNMYLKNSQLGIEAIEYLHKRGLSDETINKFEIGLAPRKNNSLYETLKEKGYNEIDMLESGLIKNQDGYFDLFMGRIMFPIIDEKSNVLGFSGRIFNKEDHSKYVNSPESKIFKKGDILFNLNNAYKSIRRKNRAILVEGQLDVISLDNVGLDEAICSLGTALTINQANLIKRYTDNVVIAYDGDKAGRNATVKAIDILKRANLNVKIAYLPSNLDPDEYLKLHGKENLIELFNNLIYEVDFLYSYYLEGKDLNNLNHIEIIKSDIFNMLKKYNSNTLTENILSKLSIDLNISTNALYRDYSKYNTIIEPKKPVEKKVVKKELSNSEERSIANLLLLSLEDKEILEYILKEISPVIPICDKLLILLHLNSYYQKTLKKSASLEEFIDYMNEANIGFLNAINLSNRDIITDKTNKEKLKTDCINSVKKIKHTKSTNQLREKISSIDTTPYDLENYRKTKRKA